MMEQSKEPVRPWHWPRIWWHDENFWREVTTRAVAALIVLLIGYLFATAAGYIRLPPLKTIFAFILCVAMVLISPHMIFLFARIQALTRRDRLARKKKVLPRWVEEVIFVLVSLVIIAVCYLSVAVVSAWGDLGTMFVH